MTLARRIASVFLALVVLVASGWGALVGMVFGFSLKCGDACGTPPPWGEDPTAWQWDALGWIGVAGFVVAVAFVLAVVVRRVVVGAVALVAWIVLGYLFLDLLNASRLSSHPGRGIAGLAAVTAVAAWALVLARRPARERVAP